MKLSKAEHKAMYALLHQIVRKRDGEKCLRCGKKERLQISHIYPKGRYRSMEFVSENVKLLCMGCHLFWWHRNPIEAAEWIKTAIPKERYEKIRLMAMTPQKIDYKLLMLYLQKEANK